MIRILTHIAYLCLALLIAAMVPVPTLGDYTAVTGTIIVIGVLGAWRYSWALTNYVRAVLYMHVVYPIRRANGRKRYEERNIPAHAYFMVTSYMVDPDVTTIVYQRMFHAASLSRGGATIVASVVDGADERLIKNIFRLCPEDLTNVRLVIDRIPANGKRDAMTKALKKLAKFLPTRRDIVIFVDGDTVVPEDIVEQSAPWFTNDKIGALTTHEHAITDTDGLYSEWFDLRFRQRQVMMCSMGLARHVLTLTGRMSVFRADLAVHPEFINGIGYDTLDHWRLGRINFLTGDDKSTWYWLLKNGYEMLYLPDVVSESFEAQPRKTFFDSAQTLMVRWYGNMMRTNGRALRLSPKTIGFFTWWSIFDQRVSMWTTLVGPTSVLLTAFLFDVTIIPLYISWVMLTRYVYVAMISLFNNTWFDITHPPLLYFGQIVGGMVKTFVLFRLDRQKWTRQGSGGGGKRDVPLHDRVKAAESTVHHVLNYSWLVVIILALSIL